MSTYRMHVRVGGLVLIEADSPDAAVATLLSLEPTIALANVPQQVFEKEVEADCRGEREHHHLQIDNSKHVIDLELLGDKLNGRLDTDAS